MATMLLLWLQFVRCQLWDSVGNVFSPWQGVGEGHGEPYIGSWSFCLEVTGVCY